MALTNAAILACLISSFKEKKGVRFLTSKEAWCVYKSTFKEQQFKLFC